MFYKSLTSKLFLLFIISVPNVAQAWQFDYDRFSFKLNGYGTIGVLEPKGIKPDFVGDWRLRNQINYAIASGQMLGLVYAIDAASVDEEKYIREAFGFFESSKFGRIEFGLTDSIARKLGVGLPDVGGLRVNDKPLFYKKIRPEGPVISDTTLTTGRSALRLNIVSLPTNFMQYGISFAGLTDNYDYAIDAGLKIRQPDGKVKTAFAFGASFMDKPNDYRTDAYTPVVNADWRAQVSAGMNVQYNSWMWGLTTRLIYDENPIGPVSDGLAVGTGVSYDLLNYSISLSYIFSDTGIWNRDVKDYIDNTIIGSFRYKYSENVDGWTSLGFTNDSPFISAGIRISF